MKNHLDPNIRLQDRLLKVLFDKDPIGPISIATLDYVYKKGLDLKMVRVSEKIRSSFDKKNWDAQGFEWLKNHGFSFDLNFTSDKIHWRGWDCPWSWLEKDLIQKTVSCPKVLPFSDNLEKKIEAYFHWAHPQIKDLKGNQWTHCLLLNFIFSDHHYGLHQNENFKLMVENFKSLEKMGFKFEGRNQNGETSAHIALKSEKLKFVNVLIQANPNAWLWRNGKNQTIEDLFPSALKNSNATPEIKADLEKIWLSRSVPLESQEIDSPQIKKVRL